MEGEGEVEGSIWSICGVCAVGGLKASVRCIICFCNAQVGVGVW